MLEVNQGYLLHRFRLPVLLAAAVTVVRVVWEELACKFGLGDPFNHITFRQHMRALNIYTL